MNRLAILAAGFSSLLIGSAGALGFTASDHSAIQNIVSPTDRLSVPAGKPVKLTEVQPEVQSPDATWSDASLEQNAESTSQSKENPDLIKSPRKASGQAGGPGQDFSVSEPVELSSGPAPKEAPVPRAGWIALTGVLGVIAARWYSAARRSRTKSAAG
ncbi:MAG TPA: hypothetical protein VGG44_08525 [Tepidisphaeraceae bacterium]